VSDAVIISVISAVGLIMSGVLVELIRARHRQDKVVKEVSPNGGGSIRDAVDRIEKQVDKVRETQVAQGERLAKVEARVESYPPHGRRSTDGG